MQNVLALVQKQFVIDNVSATELRRTEGLNSSRDNVGPDLVGCRGMGTEIGAGLSGTRTGPNLLMAPTSDIDLKQNVLCGR